MIVISYQNLLKDLHRLKNPAMIKRFKRFFKTGKGEYGEGDQFLGLTVPQVRQIAAKYKNLPLGHIQKLLRNKIHECRLSALIIVIGQYRKGSTTVRKNIFDLYLRNTAHVNNWDLVDVSAHKIVGPFLAHKEKSALMKLAKSDSVWERRISVLATFHYIAQRRFKTALRIARMLLHDQHDLIHKAAGWMLREVGKKDQTVLEKFLDQYGQVMPRTMLRYAIEKMSAEKRKYYLAR